MSDSSKYVPVRQCMAAARPQLLLHKLCMLIAKISSERVDRLGDILDKAAHTMSHLHASLVAQGTSRTRILESRS